MADKKVANLVDTFLLLSFEQRRVVRWRAVQWLMPLRPMWFMWALRENVLEHCAGYDSIA